MNKLWFKSFWLVILKVRDKVLRDKNDLSQSLESTKLYPILASHPVKLIVDIGANDGFNLSNSYYFIKKGWSAILVDPIPNSMKKAKATHQGNNKVSYEEVAISKKNSYSKIYLDKGNTNNFFSTLETDDSPLRKKFVDSKKYITVKTITLNDLFSKHLVPKEFAMLSIDVEGHESKVLETLGAFRPAVILVERSLESISESLLKQKLLTDYSYIFAARIGCNEVYIDSTSKYIKEKLEDFAKISSIGI
jgi:FkbM family methyltransferase